MILGAPEVDLNMNLSVTTRSDGVLTGGSGVHRDTTVGAKLAIVTIRLRAGEFPRSSRASLFPEMQSMPR
jgi:citrate lyase subunit alpha / citrate CoA-transferase